jgi:hypothetical protein
MQQAIIRDELITQDAEYAKTIVSLMLEGGSMLLHDRFLWRVTKCDVIDNSETVTYGGMREGGPEPGVYRIPHPSTFVFSLERDA